MLKALIRQAVPATRPQESYNEWTQPAKQSLCAVADLNGSGTTVLRWYRSTAELGLFFERDIGD